MSDELLTEDKASFLTRWLGGGSPPPPKPVIKPKDAQDAIDALVAFSKTLLPNVEQAQAILDDAKKLAKDWQSIRQYEKAHGEAREGLQNLKVLAAAWVRRRDKVRLSAKTQKDAVAGISEFDAMVTKNCTDALKLVADDYPKSTDLEKAETLLAALATQRKITELEYTHPESSKKLASVMATLIAGAGDAGSFDAALRTTNTELKDLETQLRAANDGGNSAHVNIRRANSDKENGERRLALAEEKKDQDAIDKAKADIAKAEADAADLTEKKRVFDAQCAALEPRVKALKEKQAKMKSGIALNRTLETGPLSADVVGFDLDDTELEKFLGAFEKNGPVAELGLKAAMAAGQVDGMDAKLADATALLCDKAQTNEKITTLVAARYLDNGARLGADYIDGMTAYLATDASTEPCPLGTSLSAETVPKQLSRKMIKDGKIDVTSPGAKDAMLGALYHPEALVSGSVPVAENLQRVFAQLSRPETLAACNAEIEKLSVPADPDAQKAMIKRLGQFGDTLDEADLKSQVLSTLFAPFYQSGSVGSCFSTAPVERKRQQDPAGALAAVGEIATTGTLTDADGNQVRAVNKRADGADRLLRSWEYSVAALGATLSGSKEEKKVMDLLKSGVDNLGKLGKDKKKANVGKLDTALREKLVFSYDPEAPMAEKSGDGQSEKAAFVLHLADDFGLSSPPPIRSEDEFKAAMLSIALGAMQKPDNRTDADHKKALEAEIAKLTKKLAKGKTPPWALDGGGMEHGPEKVLTGKETEDKPIGGRPFRGKVKDKAERSRELLGGIAGRLKTGDDEPKLSKGISTNGQHAFNSVTDDPMLAKILAGGPDKIEANIKTLLEDPAKDFAGKELSLERVTQQFTSTVKTFAASLRKRPNMADFDVDAFEVTALSAAPTTPLKPADLKKAIDKAIKPGLKAQKDRAKTKLDKYLLKESEKSIDKQVCTALINDLNLPKVTIADTNWGTSASHDYFTFAPDPLTGELAMWKRTDPPGTMTRLDDDWLGRQWNTLEEKE